MHNGKTCGHAGVMEFNGDVYSCDHFVFPQYKLGNIYSKTLIEMFYGEKQLEFGQNKYRSLQDNVKTVNSYLLVMVNVQRTGFVKLNWVSLG